MIYNEIQKSISSQKHDIQEIENNLETKVVRRTTPESICNMYLEQEDNSNNGSNSARKKAMK